jgi:acyl-CoA thioesterase FadM
MTEARVPSVIVLQAQGAGPSEAPLQAYELLIQTGEHDWPEDHFSDHVNNARYFAFINATFQGWYRETGLRDRTRSHAAVMARTEWNFLREVKPPAQVRCRIEVIRVGRASLVHAVRLFDLSQPADESGAYRLAGAGRVTHVYVERATKTASAWPTALLAMIWRGEPLPGAPAEPASP